MGSPDEVAPEHRFRDKGPDELSRPDINPYLKLHRELGPPVITAEQAPSFRGRWADAFAVDGLPRSAPLHVEIGSGNGFFLAGMAARHPERDWLGIEIRFKRVVLCAKKIRAEGVANARIMRYDAWFLDDIFEPGEVAGLYVNHPDPWPKDRHAKKRLLGTSFAGWAARALQPGACLRLKTDYADNVELLLESVADLPFAVVGRTVDIRATGAPWGDDDVITNYQSKFYRKNEPVHALELRRQG